MSMRCRVNNRITLLEEHSKTLEEEDMEAVEDTKVAEDTEAEEEVEDQSSAIIVGSKVTMHETI